MLPKNEAMPAPETNGDIWPSWLAGVWFRAIVLHPALFVAPWVCLCLVLAARPGSDINDVGWGFPVIPLGAAASFVTTVVMASRHSLTGPERALLVLLGLLASGAALVLGFVGWFQAAEVACHGGYECPF